MGLEHGFYFFQNLRRQVKSLLGLISAGLSSLDLPKKVARIYIYLVADFGHWKVTSNLKYQYICLSTQYLFSVTYFHGYFIVNFKPTTWSFMINYSLLYHCHQLKCNWELQNYLILMSNLAAFLFWWVAFLLSKIFMNIKSSLSFPVPYGLSFISIYFQYYLLKNLMPSWPMMYILLFSSSYREIPLYFPIIDSYYFGISSSYVFFPVFDIMF